MAQEDINSVLPAICLVFGDTYLSHANAPLHKPDHREQSLVDLLCSYLNSELASSSTKLLYGDTILIHLAAICKILKLWSEDLSLIYQIREGRCNTEVQVRQIAQRFLERIRTLENCTIIPNGLISAEHTEVTKVSYENVSVAILKKEDSNIDWIQVNPGSAYHQSCQNLVGQTSNAYLEIAGINPDNITEDWLYLLVGLKAVSPGPCFHYKEVSLYKCLLAQLNGKTVFQTQPDEGFTTYSHTSPGHTWQIIERSLYYLLRHFLGIDYRAVYQRLFTGFKLFLMEKTFAAYQDKANNKQMQLCHFLLQEMCRDIAQLALDQGNVEQKAYSLSLIVTVKRAIELYCSEQEKCSYHNSRLNVPHVLSLSSVPPRLTVHSHSSSDRTRSSLHADPDFVQPSTQNDIIHYLKRLKLNFIDKLVDSNDIYKTALLSYGIEVFFIDYLSKTDILQKSTLSAFSRDDAYLGNTLKKLAVMYYGCQARLVNNFLSDVTYQPQFFAKNVTIQFFVYAAIAALNLRHVLIGSLLATHNLCVAVSGSLTLNKIIPQLVIQDARWIKLLFAARDFFTPEEGKNTLFSYKRFSYMKFRVNITNDAEETDTDVAFAYRLLQEYPMKYRRFISDYDDLEDEKLNRKWSTLTYSNSYLPERYILLSKVAHLAKVSLTGFPGITSTSGRFRIDWNIGGNFYWNSTVGFQISYSNVSCQPSSKNLTSYLTSVGEICEDPYQRFVARKENIGQAHIHFLENEIIASQDKKPENMDCVRFMHLGFLQSEPQLKLERLYIALKKQQLDFSCKQESILIKQTLFEISLAMKIEERVCSLLEWTAYHNPGLIHSLGLLCIEKARAMQYRLTLHHAIGEILEVSLGLLSFYPSLYKDEFIEGIVDTYRLLKEVLALPPTHLSDNTLLHLNAYLIISVQAKPQLLETETLTVLKALLAIQNYKVKGIRLNNNWTLRLHIASFIWRSLIDYHLEHDATILNDLMLCVIPQWSPKSLWQKSQDGLLFSCGDYAIKPLLGAIYFQSQPIMGLPDAVTEDAVFNEYFGKVNFAVIPASRELDTHTVPCYLSVERQPQIRLTLIPDALLIEEWIESDYQLYIPAKSLLGNIDDSRYSFLLYQSPHNRETLRHWLDNDQKILIKDQQRRIIYEWNLESNDIFSLQHQGYVVPCERLEESCFKTWLERVELCRWVELIAQPSSDGSYINIQSLHFPRLGLHFDYRDHTFFSKQIHGYVIAEQQHLNTLQGFSSYLVLEKKESRRIRTKVVIPRRKIKCKGYFSVKTTIADLKEVSLSPLIILFMITIP